MKTINNIGKITHSGPTSYQQSSLKLTKKAFLNAFSSFLDYFANVVVLLVITPILVNGMGSALYGVWQILKRLVSYLSTAEGRPTQALKCVIANYQHSDDTSLKRRIIGSALGVWLIFLPLLVIVGVILVWLSPVFTKVSTELVTTIRIACSLLVINLILYVFITIPESVLRGMNLGYKRMGLIAGLNVFGGVLIVGAIYLKLGLIGVVVAQLMQTIVTGILFLRLVRIYIPWFGLERVSLREIRQFFRLSIWYSGWNLVDKLLISSDVVILGILISSSTVTIYVLTGYMPQTLIAVMTMVVGAAMPGLGGLIGKKKYARVIELCNEMLCISSLFGAVLGSMILLWNRSFITLWVGREYYAGTWVNFLLVLIAVQLLFLRNETFLIDLTLNVRRKVILGLVGALISISLAVLLIPYLGIIGLCVGILVGRLLLTIAYPAISSAFLGASLLAQFKLMFRPALMMGGLLGLSTYVGHIELAKSWIELIMFAGSSVLVIFAVAFWGGFSFEQRRILVRRVMNIKPLARDS